MSYICNGLAMQRMKSNSGKDLVYDIVEKNDETQLDLTAIAYNKKKY